MNRNRTILTILAVAALTLLLAARTSTLLGSVRAAPLAEPIEASAGVPIQVAAVSVEVGVGSPIPVEVMVAGSWPHLCAQLAAVTQQINGNQIEIVLTATEEPAGCPPDVVGLPFRLAIPLNAIALDPGEYSIKVNGVESTLAWGQGH